MKISTTLLLTLIIWIVAFLMTWGEVSLILLVVKWLGVKFVFLKWSILLTLVVFLLKGIFKNSSSK